MVGIRESKNEDQEGVEQNGTVNGKPYFIFYEDKQGEWVKVAEILLAIPLISCKHGQTA